jgi:hypothetical protein
MAFKLAIRLQDHIGGRIIGVGVHCIRPDMFPRRGESDVARSYICDGQIHSIRIVTRRKKRKAHPEFGTPDEPLRLLLAIVY